MEGSQDNLGYHYQYVMRHCIKGSCQVYGHTWFQRSRATRGGTVRQQTTPANRDSLLFVLAGFLPRVSSHAAELIHNSTTKPLRRRPDRTQRLLILMVGDTSVSRAYRQVSLPSMWPRRHQARSKLLVHQMYWMGACEMFRTLKCSTVSEK